MSLTLALTQRKCRILVPTRPINVSGIIPGWETLQIGSYEISGDILSSEQIRQLNLLPDVVVETYC